MNIFTYEYIVYEVFFITDKVKTITTITIIKIITNAIVNPIGTNANTAATNHPNIGISEKSRYNNHAAIIAANATAKNARAAIIRIKKKEDIMPYAVKKIYIIVTSTPCP